MLGASSLFIPIAMSFQLATVSTAGSKWQDDYGEALNKARSQNRPLVVIFDDPSDRDGSIDDEILRDNQTLRERLKKFELCRLDVTTEYGKRVAEAFKAKEFPYTAVTDKSCRVIVRRKVGDPDRREWVSLLAQATARNQKQKSQNGYSNAIYSRQCFT